MTEQMTESTVESIEDDDETYLESVNRFIKSATWLTDQHRPAIKLLRSLARQFDRELELGKAPQAAYLSQFGLAYRDLAKVGQPAAKTDDTLPPPFDFGAFE